MERQQYDPQCRVVVRGLQPGEGKPDTVTAGHNAKTMDQKLIGRYIVSDPRICHGKPTFRGTRIMVSRALEQVAGGLAWGTIVEERRGDVTREAISEAVYVVSRATF